ncbi:MAG: hypothetical protein EOO43_10260 [Flavobacterium sp.]|nr:MAG: hypothetical protein EOO43_10260 [Flavobacterium sp.]
MKKGTKFPIELINNRPFVLADMVLNNNAKHTVKLLLDCGASHALSMQALNEKPFPLPDSTIVANLGVGLNGLIDGHIGRIPAFNFGKYHFKNILSGFPAFESVAAKTGYKMQDGNLGAEFLRRFNITYDYQQNSIYLKPNNHYKEPFEYDMSGIETYVENDRYFIGRIEAGSPAAKAGIVENDELLSLNLKPIEQYSLDDISKFFKLMVLDLAYKNIQMRKSS